MSPKIVEVDAHDLAADALRTGRPIERRPEYSVWGRVERIQQGDSDNHVASAAALDLVNAYNKAPVVMPLTDQIRRAQSFMESGAWREFGCRTQYQPITLDYFRVLRTVALAAGRIDVSRRANECLRAAFGFHGLSAAWVVGCILQHVRSQPNRPAEAERGGPRVVTADVPLTEANVRAMLAVQDPDMSDRDIRRLAARTYANARSLPSHLSCGPRSLNIKPRGTSGQKPKPDDPRLLRDLAPAEAVGNVLRDAVGRRLDDLGTALEGRGLDGHWLDPDDASVVDRAMRGNVEALGACLDWVLAYQPRFRFRVIRWANLTAVFSTDGVPLGLKAPLAGTWLHHDTGVQMFLALQSGARSTAELHAETVTIADDGRSGSGRVKDRSLPGVDFALQGMRGDRLLDVAFGGGGPLIARVDPRSHGGGTPAPLPPPPTEPPPPGKLPWWKRVLIRLGLLGVLIGVTALLVSCWEGCQGVQP